MKPRLIIEQAITPFVNKYAIYQADDQGEKNGLVALAQQKRLAFKEKVIFYSDESKTTALFSFRAEKVMDVHGRYYVEDAEERVIGIFRKEFKASLINSTWTLMDAGEKHIATIKESNQVLALLRRFADFIPFVGGIFEIIIALIRYHFSYQDLNKTQQGMYKKTTLLRDHYMLSMTDDMYASLDWRAYAAMSVALDALQSR